MIRVNRKGLVTSVSTTDVSFSASTKRVFEAVVEYSRNMGDVILFIDEVQTLIRFPSQYIHNSVPDCIGANVDVLAFAAVTRMQGQLAKDGREPPSSLKKMPEKSLSGDVILFIDEVQTLLDLVQLAKEIKDLVLIFPLFRSLHLGLGRGELQLDGVISLDQRIRVADSTPIICNEEDAMLRLDMSKYMERHTASRRGSFGFLLEDNESASYAGLKGEAVKAGLMSLGIGLEVSDSIKDLVCEQGEDKPGETVFIDVDASGNTTVSNQSNDHV
ncbi:hypothetical protein V6N13_060951 [Hibiscus sabdariffa]